MVTLPFLHPTLNGRLIKRYKRFFVDVELSNGEVITAHTPNTGSMKGLLDEGNQVLLTHFPSPKRKLAYTLQAILVGELWVGCNTSLPNSLVKLAIENGVIDTLVGYSSIKQEVVYGKTRQSRIDLFLSGHPIKADAFVEVKNVTLKGGDFALFPDAVTARGQKHLKELIHVVEQGKQAAMVFVCQRTDCTQFAAAKDIDPVYAALLLKAAEKSVQIHCIVATVSSEGISISGLLPVIL